MPLQNIIQSSWAGGEFSKKLLARVDLAKYAIGAETLENFHVMPWGGLRKRGGTAFQGNTKGNVAVRLIPFVFSSDSKQAYVLEFGPDYFRIYTSAGVVTNTGTAITAATAANPVVLTTTNSLANGDRVLVTGVVGMVELNNREFTVASASGTTIELSGIDGTAYTAYASGGTVAKIVEVVSPYGAADLAALDFTQSADTLYMTHPDYAPRIVQRTSNTAWTIAVASIVNGPFRDINTSATTLVLSGGSATSYGTYAQGATGVTMTASTAIFDSGMVGGLFRLYGADAGGGWSQLVANVSLIDVDKIYENAGNVYVVTGDALGATNWEGSMILPTHERGTVRHFKDGVLATYADLKYIHDGSVFVRVTAYTSTTIMTVTIEKNDAPAEVIGSKTTAIWEEGAFSTFRGWPAHVTLFEERLWFANGVSQPQAIWASMTSSFLDFQDGDDDDRGLTATILSEQVDAVQWLSGGRSLSIGTVSGEYVASAETPTKGLTPKDFNIRRQTTYGTADNLYPARIGEVVMFGQRNGDSVNASKRIREHAYNFQNDNYLARDVTILADHVTGSGVIKFAYQASPYSIMWANRSDGQLAAMTYERDQEVLAWHRHLIASSTVEDIAVIPGTDGDDLWVVSNRTISGGTERHIERMTPGHIDGNALASATMLDAHLVFAGASTTSISGLWHLRGETVRVFSGTDKGTAVVSATGKVTVAATTAAVIGYGYTAKVQGLRVEAGIASGTAQGKRKRISEATLRVFESAGGTIGGTTSRADALPYSRMEEGFAALSTGDVRVEWPDGWGYDGRYYIEHTTAEPFIPVGLIMEVRGSG